ncbi:MAG: aminoglycoside phosphotransferase family protein [Bacteriovoracaceae bacterium]
MKPLDEEREIIERRFNRAIESKKIPMDVIVDIDKLTGDASTRRYFRLNAKESSYVICLDKPLETPVEDYPFYQVQSFLHRQKIRVPIIYEIDLVEGFLLEEDLGDQTLIKELMFLKDKEAEFKIYKDCIDLILKVHHLKVPNDERLQYRKLSFDFSKLMSEMDFTLDYLFTKFLKHKISDRESTILKTHLGNICVELANQPMVLTHRDYHSRNIMIKNGELVLIDFQDARMGIPQYDLVSILEDCYYSLDQENVDKLKIYYYETLPCKDLGQENYDKFLRLYDLMTVQRVFKAVGSFAYIYNWRRDKRYIKYIGFAMEKVRKVLMKYPEFNELRLCMNKIYYEN